MLYSYLIICLLLPYAVLTKSCAWTDKIMSCVLHEPFYDMMFKEDMESYHLSSYTFSRVYLTASGDFFSNNSVKILFDLNTKAFQGLRFSEDVEINLINFNGFNGFENPFQKSGATNRMTLNLYSSYFDFYINDQKIDQVQCETMNKISRISTILNSVRSVTCNKCRSKNFLCPAILKNANLELLSLDNNNVQVITIPTDDARLNLNCTIKKLELLESDAILFQTNNSFLNSALLFKTEHLIIKPVRNFQSDLFQKKILNLKYLELFNDGQTNLTMFDYSLEWMRYLNSFHDVTQQQLLFKINDSTLVLSDDNFCSIQRNFPHDNFVFPILEISSKQECTCSLIWMLKNKEYFIGNPDILITPATESCLNDNYYNFDIKVSGCKFEEKSKRCAEMLTTTTTTTVRLATEATVKEDNTYFILAIVFISTTGTIVILILLCCIYIFKGHKSRNKNRFNDSDVTSLE